jgi:hypothetical protein
MKRLALILFICATTTMVSAQDYLGVQLGFAQPVARLNTPTTKTSLLSTSYNGFKVGLVYDVTIIKGFGVSMALNYTFGNHTSAWKQIGELPYPQERTTGQYHQLEIPIDWQYKFEIAKRTWIILYTGPTLQCGLDLTSKLYKTNNGKEIILEKDNSFYSEDMKDKELKRINVTWGLGAGFQYDRYFLRGGYDFGLINPYKASQFDYTDTNGGHPRTRGRFDQWQIKLGMYFWQSK